MKRDKARERERERGRMEKDDNYRKRGREKG